MNKKSSYFFAEKIIDWYTEQKRNLPWRNTKDPYKVWLSEVILQQTRVAQGLPYYQRFLESFPTIELLAKAPEKEVLRLWQGLGYYSRARNLHKCAKAIVEQGGVFPNNFLSLKKLPGVGDYTAAAIASFCFDEAVPVVDGNVYRVLSRVFNLDTPIQTPGAKKTFFEKAKNEMPPEQAATFNQAIMEFGALQCVPKNPDCETCVLKKNCEAYQLKRVALLPVKQKKTKIRKRYFYYLVKRQGKKYRLKQRNEKDIWQGLYDFDLVETQKEKSIQSLQEEFKPEKISDVYKHLLTHQTIYARFLEIHDEENKNTTTQLFGVKQLEDLPKPKLIVQYLKDEGILD